MINDKTLFLNLGYKCNYNCVYCVIGGIQEEFGSDDFVSFEKIKEIDLKGYKRVWLTGGEPTIHPNFFEILEYFNSKGFNLFLQTNGSMLGNQDFFNKIKKYDISYQIPINSFDEKIHNTIMKHKNAFNLSLSGIKNLINVGFKNKLTVKIILTKLNFNQIETTILFLNSLGINKFYIAYPVLKGNYLKYLDKLVPKYSEIKPFLNNLIEIEKNKNIHYILDSFPYCVLDENQYKNEWEIGQLKVDKISKLKEKDLKNILNISNSCFKNFGIRDEKRDCNNCKIINLKEKLNNVSFLHKGLNKEINADCLDNNHKIKNFTCLSCNYNLICSGISKEYINLFGFGEFNNSKIVKILKKDDILNYINYIINV